MKIQTFALLGLILFSSFTIPSLKGVWIFQGGVYNGKKEGAPKEYSLQRKYDSGSFNAFLLEKGEKPQRYQSGKYTIDADAYLETETYSSQPSKMMNKTMKYHYVIRHDTLVLKGTLPSGMTVEEYWKKSK